MRKKRKKKIRKRAVSDIWYFETNDVVEEIVAVQSNLL